ncbi:tetratricopeptide repeat protein [Tenacibaculum maritimum]|uniref:tetratricopeptide repeat protein n=1 Tax=Tenacibaculum maritimum TaxID=107401 RepID=UPI0010A2E6E1|nr:tetratricopeptide repeat protein [Tenacibaculum maritimum]QCD63177.1 hypothetical protein B9C57_11895 [Tenacibaculum maritimum]
MKKAIFLIICGLCFVECKEKPAKHLVYERSKKHDSIIDKYVINGAKRFNYKFQMKEWQDTLDEGLKVDSTIAYLWQQKAMPYFKARKYEVGMEYLDKAVYYNPSRWLSYRAFIKCIFAKRYREAIIDFEKCIDVYGNGYEMDHTYQFYIAVSKLQLNKFEEAERILKEDIKLQKEKWKKAHLLDLFYLGISKYEQGKWKEAIIEFDNCLIQYPNFSDVQYYKSLCLSRLGKYNESKSLYQQAKKNGLDGYTFSESNSVYEKYPYQVRW